MVIGSETNGETRLRSLEEIRLVLDLLFWRPLNYLAIGEYCEPKLVLEKNKKNIKEIKRDLPVVAKAMPVAILVIWGWSFVIKKLLPYLK